MNRRDFLKSVGLAVVALPQIGISASGSTSVLIEAESFQDPGGWGLDQQFMDQMGSPYLLAHGLGNPVKDAVTTVKFPETGEYKVWVRTKDWVGQWKTPDTPEVLKAKGTPGEFQIIVNGKTLPAIFGNEGAEWHWQDGGKITISGKKASLALHDLTGFDGRCEAILFTTDEKLVPPNTGKEMAEFRRQLLGLPGKPQNAGKFDLVVVGGGIAGTCAALSAARLGLTVALIQDRPVLGGNNSSEVRVWLSGEVNKEPYPRIGDIVKELDQKRRGHPGTGDMYEDEKKLSLVKSEKKIKLFIDFRANEVQVDSGGIKTVVAQNTRTGRKMSFKGKFFADCTGDAIIGVLAGADHETRMKDHMGPSNLWNAKDTGSPVTFPRCPWALDLSTKPFPGRGQGSAQWSKKGVDSLGRWFWETGFDWDPIKDREKMRDWNMRAMFGAWDALKNVDKLYPNHVLEWSAYISGPRESRQILGDVILNREDLVNSRKWDDGCFPCTWSIDLHTPHLAYQKGFEGNEFISQCTGDKFPRPYWAPYRCLYSRNIPNLFMAGRDISVTHDALGVVRVMRTCGAMGEIVGMAASLCKKHSATPRDVYQKYLEELKQLMAKGTGKVEPAKP
ncbi:MAG: FAD-dependent oxidoreductase [Kiritimatiellae bacterium]|nr:FAD-dependent oxidoreductase [Kiritimatiellia bacterium]MDD5519878.1 FAD-dependent oxidoreductase [Kiritimatiellia bacterium]